MYEKHKVLAVIPARGGSKGVLRKNVRDLHGRPLIEWTIEQAKQSRYIDRVIVSTEDEEIGSISREAGAETPFVRPVELASDTATGADVLRHAIVNVGDSYDYVVLLQPTSPLRDVCDIDEAISLCIEKKVHSVVSVSEADKSPYWMYQLEENGSLIPLTELSAANRQELPTAYSVNGAVYVLEIPTLLDKGKIIDANTLGYIMPRDRSFDIDTELDFTLCDFLKRRMDSNE